MAKDPPQHHDPEDKRSSGKAARGETPVGRSTRRGNSGYGVESLRPLLRDQLDMGELLRGWPPPYGGKKPKRSDR